MRHAIGRTIVLTFALFVLTICPAHAQTYTVLHTFTGGADGGNPNGWLTAVTNDSYYGTTYNGGNLNCIDSENVGCGTVYRLTHRGAGWTLTPLYAFGGGSDGSRPFAGVIIGPNGTLYGTTPYGGGSPSCSLGGCGTVFTLAPGATVPTTPITPWLELVLHSFPGQPDGINPIGGVVFDQAGNLYGTTFGGGAHGNGSVYELTPTDGGWVETLLYSFTGGTDGSEPFSGLVLDFAGNLYGTTTAAGANYRGTVYELSYSAGSGWSETVLYSFPNENDGQLPMGALMFDSSGNLYGTTTHGGAGGGGTVFELSPSAGGGWTFRLLYSFVGRLNPSECGPQEALTMDSSGTLYGTTACDGAHNLGNIFKLIPSNGGWTYTSLHDFTGGSDGANASSTVTIDASGNLYGTVQDGGEGTCGNGDGCGVVWEITP